MGRLLILTLCAITIMLAQEKQGKDRPDAAQTFKGVIDQRDSDYVLANADNMELIAILRGRGFDKENFARFVGDPVEVKGRLVTEAGAKILYVSAVSDIQRTKAP